MDRYQKVDKPKAELSPIKENEIRITSQGLLRNYISYASTLLQERHGKEIVLKAMGQAISKTVALAEIMKRRIPQLHQDTAISSVSVTDVWEPIEEGLLPVEQTRHVSMVSITLSYNELNKNSPGYQAPTMEQGPAQYIYPPQQSRPIYNAENEGSYTRGRGHGRGRGRGWGRGGYANYQENGGYSGSGRGVGYGYHEDGGYSGSARGGGYGYRENGGYSNRGRSGGYGYVENGGYSNRGRGGGYGYGGYKSGRGGGRRGYDGRGRSHRAGGEE